jgi:hypothetical protein
MAKERTRSDDEANPTGRVIDEDASNAADDFDEDDDFDEEDDDAEAEDV